MVQRFPGKVSSNSEGCWISWMQTIQPKILEIPGAKLNKTSGKKRIRKLGYTSRACPLLWTFWKMLFHSLLEVAENSNQSFWLNGKRPGFYFVTRGWGEGGEWSAYLNCNVFIEDNLLEGCKTAGCTLIQRATTARYTIPHGQIPCEAGEKRRSLRSFLMSWFK